METRYRISELFPNVLSVSIAYKRAYLSAFKLYEDTRYIQALYKPNYECEFEIRCLNIDCTRGMFNLYSIVSNMIAHKVVTEEGVLHCNGEEARDHSNSCPCKLDYKITIAYKREE